MNRIPAFLFTTLLLGAPLLPACSTSGCGAAMNDAPGLAEGNDDQATEIATVKSLIGAYQASGTDPLRGLLLAKRSDGTQVFAAERKLAACAQPQHLGGTFRVSASSSSLTLTPESGASLRYRYEKTATGLNLYDGATVVGRLSTVPTYCTRSADCDLQSFIHPACVGRSICSSDQRCGYTCGGDLARGYGDVCGGIAGLQCASGLSCGLEDDRGCAVTRPFPDQSGVCRSAGCTGYRCATGESCRLQEGTPTCQPDKVDLCARVRCRGEQPHCVESQGESACLAVDTCHRDSECPAGQRCQPANICTREPCFAPLVCK